MVNIDHELYWENPSDRTVPLPLATYIAGGVFGAIIIIILVGIGIYLWRVKRREQRQQALDAAFPRSAYEQEMQLIRNQQNAANAAAAANGVNH